MIYINGFSRTLRRANNFCTAAKFLSQNLLTVKNTNCFNVVLLVFITMALYRALARNEGGVAALSSSSACYTEQEDNSRLEEASNLWAQDLWTLYVIENPLPLLRAPQHSTMKQTMKPLWVIKLHINTALQLI